MAITFLLRRVVIFFYSSLKEIHRNFYTLYILPYERYIVVEKLWKEYKFVVENFKKTSARYEMKRKSNRLWRRGYGRTREK